MVEINAKNIHIVKDLAQKAFNRRPGFPGYTAEEMRWVCMFDGLNAYITSLGINPGFQVQPWQQEDSEPVGYDSTGGDGE